MVGSDRFHQLRLDNMPQDMISRAPFFGVPRILPMPLMTPHLFNPHRKAAMRPFIQFADVQNYHGIGPGLPRDRPRQIR
jgi:hypothetical protein